MKNFLFFLLLAAFLPSCKDEMEKCDEDPLCEYFTCEVNGEKWEANCESASPIFGCDPIDVQYYRNTSKNISIKLTNELNSQGGSIRIRNVLELNKAYILHFDDNLMSTFPSGDFVHDTSVLSTFIINELDTVNLILKASISADFVNKTNERIRLRNGKLKAQYRF